MFKQVLWLGMPAVGRTISTMLYRSKLVFLELEGRTRIVCKNKKMDH